MKVAAAAANVESQPLTLKVQGTKRLKSLKKLKDLTTEAPVGWFNSVGALTVADVVLDAPDVED